jgi:tetratricopeptide (TPR) repeat protein
MAAAGLWTTPSDLARFAIGLQKMLRGEKGPLTQKMAENMVTPRKEGYGLGLGIEEKGGGKYFAHGGSDEGFQALLYAHETKGYGLAVMTNSDVGFRLMPEILRSVGTVYGWDAFPRGPVKPAKLTPEALDRLAGRYRLGSDSVLLLKANGLGLEAKPTLQEAFELIPVSENELLRRDENFRYRFGPDGLSIEEDGKTRTAPRLTSEAPLPGEDLEAGRVDVAIAGYRRILKADPNDPAVAEPRLNSIGYGFLMNPDPQKRDPARAIAVFKLNTELYPNSPNTYDSLAEATEASGNKAGAIALYRKALTLASRKGASGAVSNDAVKTHAAERLKALGATS